MRKLSYKYQNLALLLRNTPVRKSLLTASIGNGSNLTQQSSKYSDIELTEIENSDLRQAINTHKSIIDFRSGMLQLSNLGLTRAFEANTMPSHPMLSLVKQHLRSKLFDSELATFTDYDPIVINTNNDELILPRDYIVVKSSPEQIFEWRQADSSRDRKNESIEDIKFLQSVLVSVVIALADKIDARYKIIENLCDIHDHNVDEIIDVISND